MNRSGKPHALLATARIANVPSVMSNIWLGTALGIAFDTCGGNGPSSPAIPWLHILLLTTAGICLYVAGNFLNDWMDREWDARNRPERALPRGLFHPDIYRNTALALALAGVLLAATVNPSCAAVASLIAVFIVIYTVWHKRGAWTVVPMGLCRGLLPMLGALGMLRWKPDPDPDLFFTATAAAIAGAALFFYIVGLSMAARRESMAASSTPPRLSGDLFFAFTGLAALVPIKLTGHASLPFIIAPLPYLVWLILCRTAFRKPIPKFVSALLAGIPWVDWMILLPFAWPDSPFPAHPLGLLNLFIPALAFILALLLQRLAPAT